MRWQVTLSNERFAQAVYQITAQTEAQAETEALRLAASDGRDGYSIDAIQHAVNPGYEVREIRTAVPTDSGWQTTYDVLVAHRHGSTRVHIDCHPALLISTAIKIAACLSDMTEDDIEVCTEYFRVDESGRSPVAPAEYQALAANA